ncbi:MULTISPECIES: chlorophyll a/b-binding protein [Prochlorococcus]|uniref:High light inducible protein hli5 n=1 Tax=Prochlorococcus marinus (strain SARG / CCMP1375 / SS120) TaxID=167539 RepID=Q7VED5_PROMA|nr:MULTISPECIES: chlorophyll a/b-binding protein [Prochlorococcus]AAP99124.1 High light inducible protein hli5 [Prochlorococcus marinus subsp. marinus str. CCMP1375]KGG11607.1 putative high light inducible protein [Prochlorococcus marinus str. LG]KGG22376.1 putative high light inducible protein [Prochlorococcus marinus str. SS2]KGG22712.1 putative high light inducible protein [Prochlorococcus marinus str. SS35]KGG32867.1 putative high light inducible protein [Prochlorococcus marinus str. SS51]
MTSNNPELSKVESSKSESQENNDETNDVQMTPSATTPDIPSFGWSGYAERVNGRFAMIGFIAILLIETISKSGFLHWAGLVP